MIQKISLKRGMPKRIILNKDWTRRGGINSLPNFPKPYRKPPVRFPKKKLIRIVIK